MFPNENDIEKTNKVFFRKLFLGATLGIIGLATIVFSLVRENWDMAVSSCITESQILSVLESEVSQSNPDPDLVDLYGSGEFSCGFQDYSGGLAPGETAPYFVGNGLFHYSFFWLLFVLPISILFFGWKIKMFSGSGSLLPDKFFNHANFLTNLLIFSSFAMIVLGVFLAMPDPLRNTFPPESGQYGGKFGFLDIRLLVLEWVVALWQLPCFTTFLFALPSVFRGSIIRITLFVSFFVSMAILGTFLFGRSGVMERMLMSYVVRIEGEKTSIRDFEMQKQYEEEQYDTSDIRKSRLNFLRENLQSSGVSDSLLKLDEVSNRSYPDCPDRYLTNGQIMSGFTLPKDIAGKCDKSLLLSAKRLAGIQPSIGTIESCDEFFSLENSKNQDIFFNRYSFRSGSDIYTFVMSPELGEQGFLGDDSSILCSWVCRSDTGSCTYIP